MINWKISRIEIRKGKERKVTLSLNDESGSGVSKNNRS
jgi:hypothetical protein